MGKVVLDASVILGLFDDADAHHASAARSIRTHRDANATFVVSSTVAAEVLVGACRQRAEDLRARQLRNAFGPWRAIDDRVALTAARLRAKHRALRLPDALVLAVAEVDAADAILTADRSWRRIDPRVQLI
jgi:predicted nucleic acid-binding protein